METLTYRQELKFLCAERELRAIENRIRGLCKKDSHADATGTYAIRSLYFDTYDDRCYVENKMGIDRRKKYRVRIYNGGSEVIKLECKYSWRGMKAKEVCIITKEQCGCLIQGKRVTEIGEEQELLKRFLLERQMELLKPKVIVEYVRTPYIYQGGNVRITFDRNIRSAAAVSDFLSGKIYARGILPEGMHVLEVKYDEMIPTAILECVAGGIDLRRTSFSKYMLCRDYGIG